MLKRDAGVLVLCNMYMHPNSVFPQCVNNGSASAELLHCAVQSGRAPTQRASRRFPLWKAVTLTAPRGTGREIWSSSWQVGLEHASETVWVSPWPKSILEIISSQQKHFYLTLFAVWWNYLCLVMWTRLGEVKKCPLCKFPLQPVINNISATEAIGVKYILGDL